jgi:hypothetical protein
MLLLLLLLLLLAENLIGAVVTAGGLVGPAVGVHSHTASLCAVPVVNASVDWRHLPHDTSVCQQPVATCTTLVPTFMETCHQR